MLLIKTSFVVSLVPLDMDRRVLWNRLCSSVCLSVCLLCLSFHLSVSFFGTHLTDILSIKPPHPFSYLLTKICKMQPQDILFLVADIIDYISRYDFPRIFRTLFNIIWKEDFCHEFSFFNGFTQTPHPLNDQNQLSMAKFFTDAPLVFYET